MENILYILYKLNNLIQLNNYTKVIEYYLLSWLKIMLFNDKFKKKFRKYSEIKISLNEKPIKT